MLKDFENILQKSFNSFRNPSFPNDMLAAFRDRMQTRYPRNKYFALRRGELPLTPEEQEFVIRIARKVGFQGDFTFDAYEEGYLW